MEYVLYVAIIGLFTGVIGTAGGGLIVLIIRKVRDNLLSFVLGISAGIMSVVIFLDLIPEAMETGSVISTIIGILAGVMLIGLLDVQLPHYHFFSTEKGMNRYLKAGLLLSIGIALHNIPEGLAIGASYQVDKTLGLSMAIMMAVQNFPEGMAVATTLSMGRLGSAKIMLITALAGVPMGIGAFVGAFVGGVSDLALSISLGFAAGAMLYIVFDELIPDAHEKAKGHWAIVGIVAGVLLGILLKEYLHV